MLGGLCDAKAASTPAACVAAVRPAQAWITCGRHPTLTSEAAWFSAPEPTPRPPSLRNSSAESDVGGSARWGRAGAPSSAPLVTRRGAPGREEEARGLTGYAASGPSS